ncbi:MAG: SpoIIE family protein phosphatase [Acidobacteria bacterium]|nr:SpoIIE family protein phosphatase [Acidobacteriota bacterium]
MTIEFSLMIGDEAHHYRFDEQRDEILIGRHRSNDLQLLNDASVSKVHARIHARDGDLILQDLGSRNGSKINEELVEAPVLLASGDVITIGNTRLAVQLARPAASRPGSSDISSMTCAISVRDMEEYWAADGRKDLSAEETKRLAVLQDIAASLLNQSDLDRLFQDCLDLIFTVIPARRGCLMILEEDELVMKAVRTADLRDDQDSADIIQFGNTIRRKIIEEKTAVLTCNVALDPMLEGAESIIVQGIKAVMCVPLWNGDRTFGLIYLDSHVQERSFNEHNLRLLTSIANLVTMKYENYLYVQELLKKKAMEKELEFASDVQKFLLPSRFQSIPGLDVEMQYITCLKLGGDYYHVFPLADGERYLFVIADVMGKGTAAALLTASLHAYLSTLCSAAMPLDEVAGRVNLYIHNLCEGQFFITMFALCYETATGRMHFVNAGHEEGLLVNAAGDVTRLTEGGLLLGVSPAATYDVGESQLEPGDLVFLFTDGLSEISNAAGEMMGKEAIVDFLKRQRYLSPADLCRALLDDADKYREQQPQHDDLTMIALKRDEKKSC